MSLPLPMSPDRPRYTKVLRSRLTHVGARLAQYEMLERAARRLDLEATSHRECEGCPICDVRVALRALDRC